MIIFAVLKLFCNASLDNPFFNKNVIHQPYQTPTSIYLLEGGVSRFSSQRGLNTPNSKNQERNNSSVYCKHSA